MRDSPQSDLRHDNNEPHEDTLRIQSHRLGAIPRGMTGPAPATRTDDAFEPIEIDNGEEAPGKRDRLDGKKPADYTDAEWRDLEGYMAAYFKKDVDILAEKLKSQRFASILFFAKYYMNRLDEKFPSPDDEAVRSKMASFFKAMTNATDMLLLGRMLLLTLAYAGLIALSAVQFPPGGVMPDATPGTVSAAATANGLNLTPEQTLAIGVIGIFVAYFVVWLMITFGTKARLQGLCSTFQSDYQQSDVKKLYSTYIQIPQAIVVARRRRHKSAEETNIAVQKTERFSRYMTWLAKRVEYYEKAFEVRFWRLLDHDFIANTTYSVAAFVFVGIFWAAFGDFVNANLPIATPVGTFPLNQVGVAAAVTLYVLSFFVLSSIPSFNVGSKEQLEEWLKIKNWTRYSKFDLHNAVADLVGDQVKEIHHAEDQIRG